MRFRISLSQSETYFFDSISHIVDLAAIESVRYDSQSTGSNTRSSIYKSFRDTYRKSHRVYTTYTGKSLECTNHTQHSTEKSHKSTQSRYSSYDR